VGHEYLWLEVLEVNHSRELYSIDLVRLLIQYLTEFLGSASLASEVKGNIGKVLRCNQMFKGYCSAWGSILGSLFLRRAGNTTGSHNLGLLGSAVFLFEDKEEPD
jgi:hypothetical protein